MLRSPALRATLRSLSAPRTKTTPLRNSVTTSKNAQFTSRLCTLSSKRPQALAISLQRLHATSYATKGPVDKINEKFEEKVHKAKLESDPEHVTSETSVRGVFTEVGQPAQEREVDMAAGIKSDIKTIKETFDLSEVPRQAYVLGLAGVLPYVATSLATLGCAYDINHYQQHGTGWVMSQDTAEQVLHILEPLQIGYGAVIISFLGAIHWGLEWANFGGHIGYPRYAIGVMAPAIAWPTTLLPLEYALITQFLAFAALYYADARAARRGWAPAWYGTYRFVLTFMVGAAIVVSLIGRGEIGEFVRPRPQGTLDRVKALKKKMPEELNKEEAARTARLAAEGKKGKEVDSVEDEESGEEEDGGEEKGDEGGEEKGEEGDEEKGDEGGDDDKKDKKK